MRLIQENGSSPVLTLNVKFTAKHSPGGGGGGGGVDHMGKHRRKIKGPVPRDLDKWFNLINEAK